MLAVFFFKSPRLMALHEKAELELITLRMRKGQNEERAGWLEKELGEERGKKERLQSSLDETSTKLLEAERVLFFFLFNCNSFFNPVFTRPLPKRKKGEKRMQNDSQITWTAT